MTIAVSYGRNSVAREKSIQDQLAANRAEADRLQWTLKAELADTTSASRFAKRARENWGRILDLVPEADIIMLWEPSRGDRDLESWVQFVARCRENGTKIYATGHRDLMDPSNPRHWRTLIEDGLDAAYESEKTRSRVMRGFASAAEQGRPHARVTYGYERVYDPRTRDLVEQRPHPEHAAVVREIVARVAAAEPLSAIARDFNQRAIPTPRGAKTWSQQTVRSIALNKTYVAIRVHRPRNGEPVREYPGTWPALVTEGQHYAAARILGDPARAQHLGPRPGRAVTLLGNLAVCGDCGRPVRSRRVKDGHDLYQGLHAAVRVAELDDLVTEVIVGRVSRPDVFQELRHVGDDEDRVAVEARTGVARLEAELDTWRLSAANGETTPASLAAVERRLSERIAAARKVAARSTAPAIRALLDPGADVRERWNSASLGARREIVRALIDVTIHASRGRGKGIHDRTEITWRGLSR